jgi:hypothetical protein
LIAPAIIYRPTFRAKTRLRSHIAQGSKSPRPDIRAAARVI